MSIWEWYSLYNRESIFLENTKRENWKAFLGTLKISLGFGLFGDIFLGISLILAPLFSFLFSEDWTIGSDVPYMFIGIPLVSFGIFMFLTLLAIFFHPKIVKMYDKEIDSEFLVILFSGLDGWFQSCVFAGVSKKERNKFEE